MGKQRWREDTWLSKVQEVIYGSRSPQLRPSLVLVPLGHTAFLWWETYCTQLSFTLIPNFLVPDVNPEVQKFSIPSNSLLLWLIKALILIYTERAIAKFLGVVISCGSELCSRIICGTERENLFTFIVFPLLCLWMFHQSCKWKREKRCVPLYCALTYIILSCHCFLLPLSGEGYTWEA